MSSTIRTHALPARALPAAPAGRRRTRARQTAAIGAGAATVLSAGLAVGQSVLLGGLVATTVTGIAPAGLWEHDAAPTAVAALLLWILSVAAAGLTARLVDPEPATFPGVELLSTYVWDRVIEWAEARA